MLNQGLWYLLTAHSQSKHLLTVLDENSMFCEPKTTNICCGEGKQNTNSQGSIKYSFGRDTVKEFFIVYLVSVM